MSRPRRSAQMKNYATPSSEDENETQIGVPEYDSASENSSLRNVPDVSISILAGGKHGDNLAAERSPKCRV